MSNSLNIPPGIPDWAWALIARAESMRWAIAERDATGEVIGTAYRKADGGKEFKAGGKRGLILPWPLDAYAGTSSAEPVYVCEGASDTAALLGLRLDAVGVPMTGHGGPMLAELLKDRHVVIVADADDAGRTGAAKIADVLAATCASVRMIEPPNGAKDARAAVIAGADHAAFVALTEKAGTIKPKAVPTGRASKGNRAVIVKPVGDERANDPAQAEQLVRLALELCRLGQTPKREPFAVMNKGANVVGLLRGSGGWLREALAREYRQHYGRVMNGTAYTDALTTLRGMSLDAATEAAYFRVGPFAGGIVMDLGTVDGAAVVVDAGGWRVVDRSPILFHRTALTGELPRPERGAKLDLLRDLLNVTDDTWPILLGWIVAALIPEMPHPILMLGGQQGTGKTTAARYVCGLFDPSDAPTRSQPRDPEAWAMMVANGWATVIDNVSSIPDWWSEALCRAVTGDGWVRRTLYTDGEVSVLSFRRVIALTSIDAGALRGDLGERLVLVDLEPITPSRRRTERALDAAYNSARPAILGAILDLLAGVLARLDSVEAPTLPRMADFARVLAAIDATIGTNALALYAGQGKRIGGEVLAADPVGEAVAEWVRRHGEWRGTAGELLKSITPDGAGRDWPKNARGLAARLKRLAPALETQGILLAPPAPTDRTRKYLLQATAQTAPPPGIGPGARGSEQHRGAIVESTLTNPTCDRPHELPACAAVARVSGLLGDSGHWFRTTTDGADSGWGEVGP